MRTNSDFQTRIFGFVLIRSLHKHLYFWIRIFSSELWSFPFFLKKTDPFYYFSVPNFLALLISKLVQYSLALTAKDYRRSGALAPVVPAHQRPPLMRGKRHLRRSRRPWTQKSSLMRLGSKPQMQCAVERTTSKKGRVILSIELKPWLMACYWRCENLWQLWAIWSYDATSCKVLWPKCPTRCPWSKSSASWRFKLEND